MIVTSSIGLVGLRGSTGLAGLGSFGFRPLFFLGEACSSSGFWKNYYKNYFHDLKKYQKKRK
jgi:hypothetical protein